MPLLLHRLTNLITHLHTENTSLHLLELQLQVTKTIHDTIQLTDKIYTYSLLQRTIQRLFFRFTYK